MKKVISHHHKLFWFFEWTGERGGTVLWVDGNTGPFAIETVNGSRTGKLTSIGYELEEAGVTVLLAPVEIEKEDASIWFVPELSRADIQMNYLSAEADMLFRKISTGG